MAKWRITERVNGVIAIERRIHNDGWTIINTSKSLESAEKELKNRIEKIKNDNSQYKIIKVHVELDDEA